jgi:hypothetical protein
MDIELISKKDLLDLTDISYGQLYRWKRKNLIPEDWFIRKSTFTGQETFFPKVKILARIDKIKGMKDNLSLDDLADVFSPNPAELSMNLSELTNRNIVTKTALELFSEIAGYRENFIFEEIFFMYILDKYLLSGEINLEEGKILIMTLLENYKNYEGKSCELFFIRKLGISMCFLVSNPVEIFFEKDARIVFRLNLQGYIEELKIKIN